MVKKVTIKSNKEVNKTPIYTEEHLILDREGETFERDRINMNSNAVAVLITTDNYSRVLLPSEFRTGTLTVGNSITAGKINEGETAEEAVIREVKEETGYTILDSELEYLTKFANSEGYSSEITYVFVAKVEDSSDKGSTNFDEDEDVYTKWVSSVDFFNMVVQASAEDYTDSYVSPATILTLSYIFENSDLYKKLL